MADKTQHVETFAMQRFSIFMQRILFVTMLIVFACWLILKQLPSGFVIDNVLPAIKKQLDAASAEKLRSVLILIEAAFSCSLLVCVFIPASRKWLIVHLITGLFLLMAFYIGGGTINVPLFTYMLFLIPVFFIRAEYEESLEFVFALSIPLILFYASAYFFKWKNFFANGFFTKMLQTNNFRNQLNIDVMPWFYIIFIIFIVRIFTHRFSLVLFILLFIILSFHLYLNIFFDAAVIFFLFPYLNWKKLFYAFNKRFEPK